MILHSPAIPRNEMWGYALVQANASSWLRVPFAMDPARHGPITVCSHTFYKSIRRTAAASAEGWWFDHMLAQLSNSAFISEIEQQRVPCIA
ncbi:MAG: hypothetical protein M1388_02795 [Thaumarchaeota archaeon]|nr:hypothetical protein [Nitrososphaerota archaeon]